MYGMGWETAQVTVRTYARHARHVARSATLPLLLSPLDVGLRMLWATTTTERNVLVGVRSVAVGGRWLASDDGRGVAGVERWAVCAHAPVCSKQRIELGTKKTSLQRSSLSRDDDRRSAFGRATLSLGGACGIMLSTIGREMLGISSCV